MDTCDLIRAKRILDSSLLTIVQRLVKPLDRRRFRAPFLSDEALERRSRGQLETEEYPEEGTVPGLLGCVWGCIRRKNVREHRAGYVTKRSLHST